ncbi:MAG TPA: hypothetical protein VGA95_05685 [Thermodesulfobacteriota bacterium]
MSKRKVLGADPLSWIKPTVQIHDKEGLERNELDTTTASVEMVLTSRNSRVPKFQTYEIKLTLRLGEDHLEFLSKLEREIMKKRSPANRKERITKNSILRAMINAAKNLDIDTNEIGDETELIDRLRQGFNSK